MRNLLLGAGLLALFIVTNSRSELLKRDLGFGLTYFRATTLPADLPTADQTGSSVLDLRYATGDAVAARALQDWLAQHATASTPVFILANSGTSTALRRQITAQPAPPGMLSLGPVGEGYAPDIAITVSPEQEYRAYTALNSETDIATLVSTTPTKIRHDEAAILAARNNGEKVADEPETGLTDPRDKKTESVPLIDSTLQRATQIHRAWAFLQRRSR